MKWRQDEIPDCSIYSFGQYQESLSYLSIYRPKSIAVVVSSDLQRNNLLHDLQLIAAHSNCEEIKIFSSHAEAILEKNLSEISSALFPVMVEFQLKKLGIIELMSTTSSKVG